MTQLFIVGIGLFLAELFLARTFTAERAMWVFGLISSSIFVLSVGLFLKGIYTHYNGWEGLGLVSIAFLLYLYAALNALAGLIKGVVAFGEQRTNSTRVKVGLVLNAIVLLPLLLMVIKRVWFY